MLGKTNKRKNIETNVYSKETAEIMTANWKDNTKSKYVYLKQWEFFCKKENINTSIALKQGLDFLDHLFKKGKLLINFSYAISFVKPVTDDYQIIMILL